MSRTDLMFLSAIAFQGMKLLGILSCAQTQAKKLISNTNLIVARGEAFKYL